MRKRVAISSDMMSRIRVLTDGRETMLKVLWDLHEELGQHHDRYSSKRLAESPETHFVFNSVAIENGEWRHFRFSINDKSYEDRLIVEAAQES